MPEGHGARDSATRAFAGVYDLFTPAGHDAERCRLETALAPDGPSRRIDEGPLSLAWTGRDQPGGFDSGDQLCVVDGHVYNADELAEHAGIRPGGDVAATLFRAHERLGLDLLPLLRGDFAFLIWDRRSRRGLLARDQLGGRPLFLRELGSRLLFASEVRNLVRLLPTSPSPDSVAIANWLAPGAPPGDRTFYEGIHHLAPGEFVALSSDGWSRGRYWAPTYRRPERVSPEEAAGEVRERLETAVRRRADAAEREGVLLSGGIDSASVAGLATQTLPFELTPRRSYSAVFPSHPAIDEAELIRSAAAHLGLRATGLSLRGGSALQGALEYLSAWELPPSSPNIFFMRPLLERAASDGVRVLLDGEGGDAVFWFAPPVLADLILRGRLVEAWRLADSFPNYGRPFGRREALGQLRQWGIAPIVPGPLRRALRRPGPVRPIAPWLTPDAARLVREDQTPAAADAPRWFSWLVDGILGSGSRLLHDVSRRHGAMAGIEPRHPLLDVDVIEQALQLPPQLAFDRRYNRPVQRQAVADLLPDEIRLRPYKSNFDSVLAESLGADVAAARALLLSPRAEIRAFVRTDEVRVQLDTGPPASDPAGTRTWMLRLWHLVTAECWLQLRCGRHPEELLGGTALRSAAYDFVLL